MVGFLSFFPVFCLGHLRTEDSLSTIQAFVETHDAMSQSSRHLQDRIEPADLGQVQLISVRWLLSSSLAKNTATHTHTYRISATLSRLVVTSPRLTDHPAMRTDDGTGHAESVPLETKVAPPSVPTPAVLCVVSSGPRSIWLISGRRQAGEGLVLEFTLPRHLPSEYHILAFPLGLFAHDT